jgi:UDP-MurNAc hydroxylase
LRVSYYGQACTLIEAGGKRILTDPWLTEGAYMGTWFHTHLLADAGVTPETCCRDIDYLFLSHEHRDHLDLETLRHFRRDIPLLLCRFSTPKLRNYLTSLGFTNIRETASGEELDLGDGVKATILATAEYTNDSALVVEHEGVRLFQETDCKLGYGDLERLGERGIDIGFYMFSGANWYPMLYQYDEAAQLELVARRRRALLRSLVQRVKLTKPKFAVPAAGPCTVLDPEMLWLNSVERGIFVDPELGVRAINEAGLPCQPLYMAASDVWDSGTGFEDHAPTAFRCPRDQYIREASERMAPTISARRAAERPAPVEFADLLARHFNALVQAQTETVRQRIDAKLGFVVSGPRGGSWTVDFKSRGPEYVREGLAPDWTYKIEVEDHLLAPFLTGEEPFFEDLLLSLRFRAARRPDEYNEPLYHFLYEPDPEKLHNWYANH